MVSGFLSGDRTPPGAIPSAGNRAGQGYCRIYQFPSRIHLFFGHETSKQVGVGVCPTGPCSPSDMPAPPAAVTHEQALWPSIAPGAGSLITGMRTRPPLVNDAAPAGNPDRGRTYRAMGYFV